MGCVPTVNKSASQLSNSEREMWHLILNTSFDRRHFYYLKTFQDNYLQNFGEFITQARLGKFMFEFKKFLFLLGLQRRGKLEADIELVPSPIVDRLWRGLICNWDVYSEFCTRFLQGFYPRDSFYFTNLTHYRKTKKYLELYFGAVDQEIWPDYEADVSLERGHSGFLRIKLADFVEFHHHFNQVIKLDEIKIPSVVLLTEQHAFRRRYIINEQYYHIPSELVMPSKEQNSSELDKTKDQYARLQPSRSVEQGSNDGAQFQLQQRSAISETSQVNMSSVFAPQSKLEHSRRLIDKPLEDDDDSVMPEDEEESDVDPGQEKVLVHYKRTPAKQTRAQIDYTKRIKLSHYFSQFWQDVKHRIQKTLHDHQIPEIVVHHFQGEICCSKHFSHLVFKEYKKFLLLLAMTKEDALFLPSHYVRLAWEYHMIETSSYQQFSLSIFNRVMKPAFLPREPTESQRMDYSATLVAYKKIFNTEPFPQIWPPEHLHFKYDYFYDYKYFNVRAYMGGLIHRVEKKEAPSQEQLEMYSKALGDMELLSAPERGNFIKIYSRKQEP